MKLDIMNCVECLNRKTYFQIVKLLSPSAKKIYNANLIFMNCIDEFGLSRLLRLLLDLEIMRQIEPAPKLRSLELLTH